MAKEKFRTVYVCSNCGETSMRWLGKCPACGAWNTMVEDVVLDEKAAEKSPRRRQAAQGEAVQNTGGGYAVTRLGKTTAEAFQLAEISTTEEKSRVVTGIAELDRVLGGGIVLGSVVLLGGEPGAGKSTMLLQMCGAIADGREVLYVTGEESLRQIKLRSGRLGIPEENISIAALSDIDDAIALAQKQRPGLLVIDSIQTMYTPELSSSPGSVSQVRECTTRLLYLAKDNEIPVFIVGHVNKDGMIAGPKVMEHIVDTVLYFEGDKTLPYRILRAAKNRFGSTNEIGLFDMTGRGLIAIDNPSETMLAGRPVGTSGNCVGCIMEGTRPIMCEVQALATKSGFATPRRAASGVDMARANLLMAVLEKRAGFLLGGLDVYINAVGGLDLDDTACDLPICMALVSSLLDRPLAEDFFAVGEVGLGGELRGVKNVEYMVKEAARIGFRKVVIPAANSRVVKEANIAGVKVITAKTLQDAIAAMP